MSSQFKKNSMKKIKINTSKLLLKKEKVANLSKEEMSLIFGGEGGKELETTRMPCTNYPTNQCHYGSFPNFCDSVIYCQTGTQCGTGYCTLIQTCPGFCR
jgi:hypothetical protein